MQHHEGTPIWYQLMTSDQVAALDFYSQLFGWQHGGSMPMGAASDYTFVEHHGDIIGAIVNATEQSSGTVHTARWNRYFYPPGSQSLRLLQLPPGAIG